MISNDVMENAINNVKIYCAFLHLTGSESKSVPLSNILKHKDKRTAKAVAKRLHDEGFINLDDDMNCVINSVVWDNIVPEKPDLVNIWQLENKNNDQRNIIQKYVRVNKVMNCNQIKWIVIHHEEYYWYIIDSYNVNAYDKITGDYRIGEARLQYASMLNKRHSSVEIVVSNKQLDDHVQEIVFNRNLEQRYQDSLGWGLCVLGIISESESELIVSGYSVGNPNLGIISNFLNAGSDPNSWGDKFKQSESRCHNLIERMKEKLLLLQKIEDRINVYGGWDKFRIDYKEKLRELLKLETQKQ